MKTVILGGGVAGLAAALAAARRGIDHELHEASPRLGGNAVTLRRGGFRFDSGAHRFHDRDPRVTTTLIELLGDELAEVSAPGRIHFQGRMVDFPLAPADLLAKLPWSRLWRAVRDAMLSRVTMRPGVDASFEDRAVRAYGRTLAEMFLLDYSEKLWGVPCTRLAPAAMGGRLNGLGLREFLFGRGARAASARHLEGRFLYPRLGIGQIADAMAAACDPTRLRTSSPASEIRWRGRRVETVVAGGVPLDVDELIATLPVTVLVRLLRPSAPREVLDAIQRIRFRDVTVVALFLDRPPWSEYACTYFPEAAFPFTRVHEPSSRSTSMSPPGMTSLVAELPCDSDETGGDEESIVAGVVRSLRDIGWVADGELCGAAVHRMRHAYPVLDVDAGDSVERCREWLDRFDNLRLVGRAARFSYVHIHDLIADGFDAVDAIARTPSRRRGVVA